MANLKLSDAKVKLRENLSLDDIIPTTAANGTEPLGKNTLRQLASLIGITGPGGNISYESITNALGFIPSSAQDLQNALANFIGKDSIVNNLETEDGGFALDARQGKILYDLIQSVNSNPGGSGLSFSTLSSIRSANPTGLDRFFTSDAGKEGEWFVDVSDTTSTDNGWTVLTAQNGMRVKRLIKNSQFSASWFGFSATATASTNTTALQNAINVVTLLGGGTINLDASTYNVSYQIDYKSNVRINGQGATLQVASSNGVVVPVFKWYDCTNVALENIKFLSTRDQISATLKDNGQPRNGLTSNLQAVICKHFTNGFLNNVYVEGFESILNIHDGAQGTVNQSKNLTCNNIRTLNVREPFYFSYCDNVQGVNWTFIMPVAAETEILNHAVYHRTELHGINVSNVYIENGGSYELNFGGNLTDVNYSNVVMRNNYGGISANADGSRGMNFTNLFLENTKFAAFVCEYGQDVTFNGFHVYGCEATNGQIIQVRNNQGGRILFQNGKIYGHPTLTTNIFNGQGNNTTEFNNVEFVDIAGSFYNQAAGSIGSHDTLIVRNCLFYFKNAPSIPIVTITQKDTLNGYYLNNLFVIDATYTGSRYGFSNSVTGTHTAVNNTFKGYTSVKYSGGDTQTTDSGTVYADNTSAAATLYPESWGVNDYTASQTTVPQAANTNKIYQYNPTTATGDLTHTLNGHATPGAGVGVNKVRIEKKNNTTNKITVVAGTGQSIAGNTAVTLANSPITPLDLTSQGDFVELLYSADNRWTVVLENIQKSTRIEAQLKKRPLYFNNISGLKANVGDYNLQPAQILGSVNLDDGGAGDYYYSTTSTLTGDDFNVVTPTSITEPAPGRWLRIHKPAFGPIAGKTASFTLDLTLEVVTVDATAGAVVATLPVGTTCVGKEYQLIKVDSSANLVSFAGNTKLVNGASTYNLGSAQWSFVRIKASASGNWFVIAKG